MLIIVTPYSQTKKLPYETVHGRKLRLPIDVALQPLQSTCMPDIGNYIEELQIVVMIMMEAASLGREEQSMSRPYEKIFGYPYKQLSASLYEALTAEGQARETAFYFCRCLPSNSGDQKI